MSWQEVLFIAANIYVLPFWFMIIFLPGTAVTRRVTESMWWAMPLVISYAAVIMPNIAEIFVQVANPQFGAIQQLLSSPTGVLLAWVHVLVFDLFVGRWVHLRAQKLKQSRVVVGIILFCTLMAGPFGLLLYLLFSGKSLFTYTQRID